MAAAVSAAGGNSRAARRPNGMQTLAALVDGRLVATASVLHGGARQATVSDFILRRIVGEVGCVLDDAARARGVRLLLTVNSDLPARLQGCSTVIRQVLFEMGSLVIRYARSGSGVTIRLGEEPSPPDQIRLRFTVKPADGPASGHPDHPPGWVDEAGEKLDTCRQLLGPVHGEFGAREQFDEGPLFWFTIPCREARKDNPEAARDNAAA